MDRVVFIHTVPALVGVFAQLSREMLPGVQVFHVLDEPLLEAVRLHGERTPEDVARLQDHVNEAEAIGARAALVTCSTLSPAVDQVAAGIPVLKIDEAMVAQAAATGDRIGVLATNPSTLGPTQDMLETRAQQAGKAIRVHSRLVKGAFAAFLQGDYPGHDRLVKAAILEMGGQVDVIVLAQASMARVLDGLPETERPAPVLTSPHTALLRLRQRLLEAGDNPRMGGAG